MPTKLGTTAKDWFEIAKADINAARLLYKNKFYPQALYFLHQSAEKIHKGSLIYLRFIDSGKKAGHELNEAVIKVLESKIIRIAHEDNGKKKTVYISKLKPNSEKSKEIERLRKTITILKIYKNHEEISLKELDKEIRLWDNEFKKTVKLKKKILMALRTKLKRKHRQNNFQLTKKEFLNILELVKLYVYQIGVYETTVLYSVRSMLPKQDMFRYPDFKPTETFDRSHPLIKRFKILSKHLNNTRWLTLQMIGIMDDFKPHHHHSNKSH